MKMTIKKVITKSVKKRLRMYESIFLMTDMEICFGRANLLYFVQ